ncbi:MAG: peptidoglycan/xylan/chitin deacetylase (PgdA/CDA1 family) [Flavobacteriales bacterium]|jgi:peptidoglycan/xylan/chitin deacetylase (PgdA/CDA1 family)
MYLKKPPYLYRKLLSKAIFNANTDKVYLTFDDGPDPEVTTAILDILAEESVTATFFVLGENAEKHPEILYRIRSEGHEVANHGYAHLDGWKVDEEAFIENVERGEKVSGSSVFRPPYGRIWPGLMGMISYHKVIMWDVLAGDFDASNSAKDVVSNVLDNVKAGSIIVMHDSQKAKENVLGSLQLTIEGIRKKGMSFGNISDI